MEVTDVNDNRVQVAYTPLGLVEKKAVMGKTTETVGDTLTTRAQAATYDLLAFAERGPSRVSVTAEQPGLPRPGHRHSQRGRPANETIQAVEYSDGFGRLIQTRAQAEDLDFEHGRPDPELGGRCDRHERGRPAGARERLAALQQQGPGRREVGAVFDEGWAYGDIPRPTRGPVHPARYDARGRKVRTIRPNGAEEWVVFGGAGHHRRARPGHARGLRAHALGELHLRRERQRWTHDHRGHHPARRPHRHAHRAVVDALGRTVSLTQRNVVDGTAESYTTTTTYDIRGNVLTVDGPGATHAGGHQVYDLANRELRRESIDAGISTAVFDAAGMPIEARDARGGLTLTTADEMLRPTNSWGRDAAAEAVRLVGGSIFGDEMGGDPKATNQLANPWSTGTKPGW